MKITFDGFEVDIKAKDQATGKYSEMETMYLLNRISIMYREAGRWNVGQGYTPSAKHYENAAHEIYTVLESKGFYEQIAK